jgi:hypothetical protein
MIKISVVFFAGARDIVGQNRLEMQIPAPQFFLDKSQASGVAV